jgi:hypothetical protein
MLRYSISKRQKPIGTHRTSLNRRRSSELEPRGPLPNTYAWPARWIPMRSSQPSPPIHGEHEGHDARSSSRAVSRSSIRFVVRSGPATGIRARKLGLLPHARKRLIDPRYQTKITSPSRLPLSRSRARRAVDPKVARQRARWGAGDPLPGLPDSILDASCIRRRPWARLSTAHPLRPRVALSRGMTEAFPRTFRRVENEPLALFRETRCSVPHPHGVARQEIAL